MLRVSDNCNTVLHFNIIISKCFVRSVWLSFVTVGGSMSFIQCCVQVLPVKTFSVNKDWRSRLKTNSIFWRHCNVTDHILGVFCPDLDVERTHNWRQKDEIFLNRLFTDQNTVAPTKTLPHISSHLTREINGFFPNYFTNGSHSDELTSACWEIFIVSRVQGALQLIFFSLVGALKFRLPSAPQRSSTVRVRTRYKKKHPVQDKATFTSRCKF